MSTVSAATKRMTAEEFFDWQYLPENEGRSFELVRGEVVEVSRPGERHCQVCGNVAWLLGGFMRQRRKGRVLSNDAGVVLERDPDTVRGPDVIFFDDVKPYDQLNPKWPEGVPALAVEVLSPNDRIGKMTSRINELLQAGIQLVWLVDPDARDVTVFRQGRSPQSFNESQELIGEDVLPDLRIPVAEFFFVAGQ
jgi:Uma2 family endonuclease